MIEVHLGLTVSGAAVVVENGGEEQNRTNLIYDPFFLTVRGYRGKMTSSPHHEAQGSHAHILFVL